MQFLLAVIILASPAVDATKTNIQNSKDGAQLNVPNASKDAASALTDALAAIPSDPRPKAITRDMHYTISNETRHYLFKSPINDIGGIHVGVGAEQNYIFAGWSKPKVMILMDFDQWIVDLHRAYSVMFAKADTPDAFIELWQKKNRKSSRKLIRDAIDNERDGKRISRVFKHSHERVGRHLKKLRKQYQKMEIPIFLTDQEQYTYLRNLWASGQVRSVRGDLTARKTMKGIGEFATKVSLPVRTLYLSNAEYYFSFGHGRYRANVNGLPFDETSKVLHTFPYGGVHYHYIYQTGLNFQAWLKSKRVSSLRTLMKKGRVLDDKDLRIIDAMPAEKK